MAAERANPPFDLRRMTYAMGGGQRGARLLSSVAVTRWWMLELQVGLGSGGGDRGELERGTREDARANVFLGPLCVVLSRCRAQRKVHGRVYSLFSARRGRSIHELTRIVLRAALARRISSGTRTYVPAPFFYISCTTGVHPVPVQ